MFMILKTRELLSIQVLKINVNEISETFANLVIRQKPNGEVISTLAFSIYSDKL